MPAPVPTSGNRNVPPHPYVVVKQVEDIECQHPSCVFIHTRYMNHELGAEISVDAIDLRGNSVTVRTRKLHFMKRTQWALVGQDGYSNGHFATKREAEQEATSMNRRAEREAGRQ